ncbi:MAG: hypothetical protein ACTSRU_10505 [Candidatus Hodarchaeales archaeon]
MAEEMAKNGGMALVTLCNGCYEQLLHVDRILQEILSLWYIIPNY